MSSFRPAASSLANFNNTLLTISTIRLFIYISCCHQDKNRLSWHHCSHSLRSSRWTTVGWPWRFHLYRWSQLRKASLNYRLLQRQLTRRFWSFCPVSTKRKSSSRAVWVQYTLLLSPLLHRWNDSVGRSLCRAWEVVVFPSGCSHLTTLQLKCSFTGAIFPSPPRPLTTLSYLLVNVAFMDNWLLSFWSLHKCYLCPPNAEPWYNCCDEWVFIPLQTERYW